MDDLRLLQLLQLADSALPTGALSHSLGLESLVEEGFLKVAGLETFLTDYLKETGFLETSFCRQAYHLGRSGEYFKKEWENLNSSISAFKPARESRQGSQSLGRRLVALALQLDDFSQLRLNVAGNTQNVHYCAVFGLLAGLLQVDEEAAVERSDLLEAFASHHQIAAAHPVDVRFLVDRRRRRPAPEADERRQLTPRSRS